MMTIWRRRYPDHHEFRDDVVTELALYRPFRGFEAGGGGVR